MLQRARARRENNLGKSGLDLKRRLSILDGIQDNSVKNRRMVTGVINTNQPPVPKPPRKYLKTPVDLDANISPIKMSKPQETNAEKDVSFGNSFTESGELNKDSSMASSRKSGDYDSFKWRRPHYGGSYQVKARSSGERSFRAEEVIKPKLVKVTQGELESPRKIEMEKETKVAQKGNGGNAKIVAKVEHNRSNDYTNSSITSISKAIDELDREIRYLEFRRDGYCEPFDQVNFHPKPPRKFLPPTTSNPRSVRSVKNRHASKESTSNMMVDTKNPYSGLRRVLEDEVPTKSEKHEAIVEPKPTWDDSESEYAPQIMRSQDFLDRADDESVILARSDEENNNDVNLETMEDALPKFSKKSLVNVPKPQRCHRLIPNLESTRRSSKFDLTRKTFQTNMESTISSITTYHTHMTSESLQDLEKRENYDNTIPSEVERFLEDALGDELNNTSITYAPADGKDALSQYNASELMSDVESIDRREEMRGLAKYYNSLNNTRSIYNSFAQRLKKKLHSKMKDRRYVISNPIVLPKTENEKMQTLLQELDVQQTVLYQASKALNLCYAMKNFTAGLEHVESERLLLLTDLKKKAILEEIKRIGSNKSTSPDPSRQKGEIMIKDIVLPLTTNYFEIQPFSPENMEWFVVTITHGSTVWASQAVSRKSGDTKIPFPDTASVAKLSPDFRVMLRVYYLKLKVVPAETKPSKQRSKRSQWKASCSTVKKMWKKTPKSQKPLTTKQKQILSTSIRNTSFSLAGQLELSLEDISFCSPWTLSSVLANTSLQGTIELNISCKLHVSVTHAGFLTHGDEAGGFAAWNRRWCVLEGHILKFWNYPQDQGTKGPLGMINLMHCITNKVGMIDRHLCAKPRTLLIRTIRPKHVRDHDSMLLECRPAHTVVRNLLSCDTVHDLMEWSMKLNHVLSLLSEWNAITTYDLTEMSDM